MDTKYLFHYLLALVFLIGWSPPTAFAQDGEDPFPLRIGAEGGPTLDFNVGLMQSVQFLQADDGAFAAVNEDASFGFHRVRFSLGLTMNIHERINAFVELGEEPNDFGDNFAPVVDLFLLNLILSENFTLQFGTPVTVLFNFRGYSDGAIVQGNPLIGNSPIDMVTAETGAGLIGTFDPVTVNLTFTVPTFFEDFGPERGFTFIGRAFSPVAGGLSLGAGYLYGNNGGQVGERPFDDIQRTGLVMGDGENYNFPGSPASSRDTHTGLIPGIEPSIVHVDAQFQRDDVPVLVRAWYGYAVDNYSFLSGTDESGNPAYGVGSQAVGLSEIESVMDFFGATVAIDLTEQIYLAGRFSLANNQSDWARDATRLTRIQAGAGFRFLEHGLFKLEYVMQTEEANSPGQIGADWNGVLGELSVFF